MIMPDDEPIKAEKTSSPAGLTSRRQAVGVMGTTVAAGMVGGAMVALGAPAKPDAVAPLHETTPAPVQVPRGDLVDVLEYETQERLVLGPTKVAPILGSDRT